MKIIRMPVLGDDLRELPIKKDGERYYVEKHDYISAGFPSPAADFQGEKISLDEKYLKPNATFILEVGGSSMEKTFQVGDKLICHSDIDTYQDAPVIVSVNFSEFTFKRFDKKNNSFVPDNPDYEKIILSDDDTVILKGVVVAFIRENLGKLS